jgi:hypothetical protein
LTENLFDIEILDDENNLIEQFEGSAEGETIENLEAGTYTVNEIAVDANDLPDNQLLDDFAVGSTCSDFGFEGGGLFFLSVNGADIDYRICFEYEDELGNDCNNITLAAGESRTCIVKNYIFDADEDL